jgi:hypothetical protein
MTWGVGPAEAVRSGRRQVTDRYRPVCIIGHQRSPYVKERRGRAVKKLLLVALAAIGGLLVYRQIQADRAEQDLWTEATDSVPTGS